MKGRGLPPVIFFYFLGITNILTIDVCFVRKWFWDYSRGKKVQGQISAANSCPCWISLCNEGLRSLAQGQLLIHLNRKTGQQQKHSYVCVPLFTGAKMFIRPWMFYYHKKGDLVNLRFPWVIPEWKCRRALHGQRRTSRPHQMDPILMGWWGPSV